MLAAASGASGQSSLGPERRDINDLRGDIWAMWTAPAHVTARDIPPVAAVLGGVVLTAFRDSAIYTWMTTHPNALFMRMLTPIRDDWKFPLNWGGSGQYLLPVSGGLYIAGRLSHDAALRDAGLGCAAGHLSSAALRDVIYLAIARTRPHSTPKPDRISVPGTRVWGRHSFLSGHIANSMACASYLGHRFDLGLAQPAIYAYVTAIGLGRMADGWHWTSDTIAGAAMGFAIGKGIADRQAARTAARSRDAAATAPPPTLRIPIWSLSF